MLDVNLAKNWTLVVAFFFRRWLLQNVYKTVDAYE